MKRWLVTTTWPLINHKIWEVQPNFFVDTHAQTKVEARGFWPSKRVWSVKWLRLAPASALKPSPSTHHHCTFCSVIFFCLCCCFFFDSSCEQTSDRRTRVQMFVEQLLFVLEMRLIRSRICGGGGGGVCMCACVTLRAQVCHYALLEYMNDMNEW